MPISADMVLVVSFPHTTTMRQRCNSWRAVTDHTISIRQMLDNAKLAAKSAKGHFSNNYALYNDTMGAQLIAEQEIINDMSCALQEKQFCIYLQPKYDLHHNRPAGAEALVRWMHPEKGMISPGEFIPVFEKNGFIAKLDYYVWEETCSLLERMKTRNLPILPISVNVSRVHLYNPQLPELLCEMLDRHHLSHALVNLELTESIYAEHSSVIQDTIAKLHENGFVVMMDDFGSGYSSLNVLKDVEFDVLKIDMRFFDSSAIKGRRENIIASIIRMAKWLGLPVIAEGVETEEQAQFLNDLGCEYVQGYYFAKPLPVGDYEALIVSDAKPKKAQSNSFIANKLWRDNDQIELMFSVIPQPLVLFEFSDDKVELLYVNQEYYNLFGYENFSNNSLHWEQVLSPDYKKAVWSAVYQAIESKEVSQCTYLREYANGTSRWIHVHLRYVNQMGNKHILFGILSNITEEMQAKETLKRLQSEHKCIVERSRKDSLTEVYNRTETEKQIDLHLKSCPDLSHCFLILDLDNFKEINDTHGHIVGDMVLKEIAQILRSFFKTSDIVGRLGGDEFVAFMESVSDQQPALRKAQELCTLISQAVFTEIQLKTSISVGICLSGQADCFMDLYRKADYALYQAKKAGKAQAKLYIDK